MASLNEAAELIAIRMGGQFNEVLKDSIKFSIKYYRAEFIRQDMERNRTSPLYIQKYIAILKKVDKADSALIDVDCNILRTTNPIPTPVRVKGAPFKFVGSPDGKKIYTYGELEELPFLKHLKFNPNIIKYTYINNYGYILNTSKLKWARFDAPYASPELVGIDTADSSGICYTDDMEFPIPIDMLRSITQGILSQELRLVPDDQEVTIKDETSK